MDETYHQTMPRPRHSYLVLHPNWGLVTAPSVTKMPRYQDAKVDLKMVCNSTFISIRYIHIYIYIYIVIGRGPIYTGSPSTSNKRSVTPFVTAPAKVSVSCSDIGLQQGLPGQYGLRAPGSKLLNKQAARTSTSKTKWQKHNNPALPLQGYPEPRC